MPLPKIQRKPGYEGYLPSSYQVITCEENPALDQVIAKCPALVLANAPTAIPFRISTPNVRCRTRVALSLEPADGSVNVDTTANTAILGGTGSLWVAIRTASRGTRVRNPPTRNVVGTGAAPLPVPTDTRLWGYEFEIETNGQELLGSFTPPILAAVPAVASEWHVVVLYEAVVPLSEEEWNQFVQSYGIKPLNPVVLS